ncbi:MAG: hydroxyisourate hydrolase [Cyanobacteria bacterium P01_A01_bin.114]
MPAGQLTTHVLDTAHGCPAAKLKLELWFLKSEVEHALLKSVTTNADGRTDGAILSGADFRVGRYRLVFYVGDYFAGRGLTLPEPNFLDQVPIQFGIADLATHYHVPLLVSPWAYSTYRGS